MSNALHDYAKLFERYAANNGGTGVILAGEDCLSLANEMRMDADAIETENAKLREELSKWERLTVGIDLPDYPVAQFVPKDLERENTKLRSLCERLMATHEKVCTQRGTCIGCKLFNTRAFSELCPYIAANIEAHKLGIKTVRDENQ